MLPFFTEFYSVIILYSGPECIPGGGLPERAAGCRPDLPCGVRAAGARVHLPHPQSHEPAQRAREPQPHRVHQRRGHAQHAPYVCLYAV